MDIEKIFETGVKNLQAAHAAHEVEKKGILRAGNTGIHDDGEVSGKCARLTYLRFKGIEVDDGDDSKELMFASGRGNEDLWMEVLVASKMIPVIKREEEIPIAWQTKKGTWVTGRPDVVLCDAEGKPTHGLELKLLCSFWTALDAINCKPKMIHLAQAAHYSWKLDVPFDLCYASRVNWYVPAEAWIQNKLPREGQVGSDVLEFTVKMDKKTGEEKSFIKTVKPFRRTFNMKIDEAGTVFYKEVSKEVWTESVVSIPRIQSYFELVDCMDDTNVLPARPLNLDAEGNEAGYKLCSYCELQSTCKTFEKKGLDKWKEAVVEFVNTEKGK